jgi:hypothetical protein
MNVKVITTLHKDGYDLYGKNNIETWIKFFPKDWSIYYYSEKHSPTFSSRINVLDFDKECSDWELFYQEIKLRSAGLLGRELNWYKKCLRWSFKMYTLVHALENTSERYLIWLDADVVAKDQPTKNWVTDTLQNGCLAACKETLKDGVHIESGALIFDLSKKEIEIVKDWINYGYKQLNILKEKKAWDGYWLAKLLESNRLKWTNTHVVSLHTIQKNWLFHEVGTKKFKNNDYSSRSGRKPESELI